MKKMMFGLMAILMGVMLAACGGKNGEEGVKGSINDLKSLFEDVKKNGSSWSVEEWENYYKDYFDALEAFFENDVTKEEYNEVKDLEHDAFHGLHSEARKMAIKNLNKDEDIEKQQQRIEKRIHELRKKWSKNDSDEETQSSQTVPGYDEEAELSKVAPTYYPTADQQLLLLKGPVLGEKLTTTEYGDPSTSSFQLDHNGWIDKHPLFDGKDIERNEKMGNRIESAYDKEPCDIDDVYPGNNYAYYSDGWLKAVTMDTPCGEAVETYELNHYNDPLSTHTEGFLGDDVNWKKVYTVTKTDCFHNWLERDVKSYDNGNLVSQWHESRVLYYLQVIEAERSTVETRPIDRSSYETISSESGGLIYFKYGPKWRCYRVEATF